MADLENDMQYFLEIKTCDPSIYTMDNPDLIVSFFMGNSIGTQRVNRCSALRNADYKNPS